MSLFSGDGSVRKIHSLLTGVQLDLSRTPQKGFTHAIIAAMGGISGTLVRIASAMDDHYHFSPNYFVR